MGSDVEPSRFSDHNLARVLDTIYETGTQKVFSAIAHNAVTVFDIDTRRAHFDTTSVSVFPIGAARIFRNTWPDP
jgi:hypothetical protein